MAMVSVKISELSGRALDYVVAQREGRTIRRDPMGFHDRSYWVWEEVPSGLGGVLIQKSVYMKIGPTGEKRYSPSTDWSLAGPIIERESITVIRCDDEYVLDSDGHTTRQRVAVWAAVLGERHFLEDIRDDYGEPYVGGYIVYERGTVAGPTPLVAAMRCYVASKTKGDSVMIPKELL
jgi:hypothetical protein